MFKELFGKRIVALFVLLMMLSVPPSGYGVRHASDPSFFAARAFSRLLFLAAWLLFGGMA